MLMNNISLGAHKIFRTHFHVNVSDAGGRHDLRLRYKVHFVCRQLITFLRNHYLKLGMVGTTYPDLEYFWGIWRWLTNRNRCSFGRDGSSQTKQYFL